MVSTQLMLAQSPSRNSRWQFHKPRATQHHHHQTSKPSRPIADCCSVTTRLHQKSRRVSRELSSQVFASERISHANQAKECSSQSRTLNRISRNIPIPQSINPGSRQRNPTKIHRPRLPFELTTVAHRRRRPGWRRRVSPWAESVGPESLVFDPRGV